MFVLTISREIQYFQDIWVNYHAFIVGVALIFVMGRLSYQSFYKKYKELICNDCANYNRRSTDLK